AQDLEDVRTLIQPQILKKSQRLAWQVELTEGVKLPANAVRQVLINLLLNAVQATAEQGRIGLTVAPARGGLALTVRNEADPIPSDRLKHLFEPFVSGREGGHGLGLWVTYQIVQQLKGSITAGTDSGITHFLVLLPLTEQKDGNV
ncbi:MAG: ATP-binding protein, partial [Sulfurimicrobium sp.]